MLRNIYFFKLTSFQPKMDVQPDGGCDHLSYGVNNLLSANYSVYEVILRGRN